ncbi:MAG: hypothetical protein H6981_01400 [Gammaproteobacteria bacterium]|nr:hypothetical protein [Gammaproteobacteria bacterium]MCP5135442.1 hypothetical protein [Gammaproteobacteria bacterium]
MAKKVASELAKEALGATHFGNNGTIASQDPVEITDMELPLDRIRRFEGNPRITKNSKWDEIKDSILKTRLRDRIPVTRRPGEEHYVVSEGGNTRLGILNELAVEYPAVPRFKTVPVTFIPYQGEAWLYAQHLAENDQRTDLKFFERALGIHNAKRALEEELGESLTQKRLVELLADKGYRAHQQHLGAMQFAVEVIGESLPEAFSFGLGRPTVIEIKSHYEAWMSWWAWRECGAPETGHEAFLQILGALDGPDFDLNKLRRRLDENASQFAEITVMMAGCEIGSYLGDPGAARPEGDTYRDAVARSQAKKPSKPRSAERPERSTPTEDEPPFDLTGDPSHPDELEDGDFEPGNVWGDDEPLSSGGASHGSGSGSFQLSRDTGTTFPPAHRVTPDEAQSAAPRHDSAARPTPNEVKNHRARMYTLAKQLATRHGLGALVEPTVHATGLGYVIDFVTSLGVGASSIKPEGHAAWWFLASLSEQFHADPDTVRHALPPAWAERAITPAIADSDRPEVVFRIAQDHAQMLHGPAFAPGLLSLATQSGHRDADLVDDLIATYRAMTSLGIPLWEGRGAR